MSGTGCIYCDDRSNPFKMGYSPLWFAWRPVLTDDGIRFMQKVHKVPNVDIQYNFVGSWPSTFYTYAVCTERASVLEEK